MRKKLEDKIEYADGWKWVFCIRPRVLRDVDGKRLFVWLEWIEQSANVKEYDRAWYMVEGVWHDGKWYSKNYSCEFNE